VIMQAYETEIDGYISELNKKRFKELHEIKTTFQKMDKDAETLSSHLLVDVPKPSTDDLNRNVIAVDGSNYQEKYESVSATIATAYVYMTHGSMERYLPQISIVPPYYATLVNSINMKRLEYEIARDVLNRLEKMEQSPSIVLLDGTITFPDEALSEYSDLAPWIKQAYDQYTKIANDFYEYILDKNVLVASVVKDSLANKYFISLYTSLKEKKFSNLEIPNEELSDLNLIINKWGKNGEYASVSEFGMIKRIFSDLTFKRTKYIEVTQALRAEIPISQLKGNVIGFYIKTIDSQKPFFVEVPAKFKDEIDTISQVISSFSYYSLRPGYPMPLYIAHKKAELKKKNARNIIALFKNLTRKDFPEYYYYLWEDRFHESL